MRIDMERFRETFFVEAAEHLETLESCLMRLEAEPDDRELLNTIFRAAHSIKGASGTFGFTDVARFTHTLESLLDKLREGVIVAAPELTGLLLRSCDVLAELVAAAKAGDPAPADVEPVLADLRVALEASGSKAKAPPAPPASKRPAVPPPQAPPAKGPRCFHISFAPGAELFRRGTDPLLVLRDLTHLGRLHDVRVDLSHLPQLDKMDPEACYLAWTARLTTDCSVEEVRDTFCFVEDESVVTVEERVDAPASGLQMTTVLPLEQLPQPGLQLQPPWPTTPSKTSPMPEGLRGPWPKTPPPQPVDQPQAPANPSPHVGPQPAAKAPPQAPSAKPIVADRRLDRSSIRVPIDKVDKLVNLVEELVVTQSMLNQVVDNFTPDKLASLRETAGAMDRNLRELQERVMAVRMVPISSVTGRFPRLIRELAGGLGKKVRFEIKGEDTELDKQVIEQIGDPLIHLIRNSADHGIEPPEDRRKAGKPEEGVIRLSASQQGDSVFIEVADDGRGLNLERIRAKAVERGLIAATDSLTDDEVRTLIFRPGFSTAEAVSDVSGRGVGMDVVKKNVEALNGSVAVFGEQGQGTRIRIKLPLTVAILDGLCLGVGDDVFIVPLLSVVESLRPRAVDVKSVLGKGTVLMVRGQALPLWPLGALMNRPAVVSDPAQGLVVIVEGEGRQYGLLVDELLGQSQVVIKTLEANYQKVEGITGATILGDGRVAMILDVHGVLRLTSRRTTTELHAEAALATA